MRRVILDDMNGGDDVPLTLEMIREARAKEVFGAGPAARTAPGGIVGDEQELDVHAGPRCLIVVDDCDGIDREQETPRQLHERR